MEADTEDYYTSGMDDYGSGGGVTSSSNTSFLLSIVNATESPAGLSNSQGYCGPTLAAIGVAYGSAHGFTSLIVCFIGCVANLLNLIGQSKVYSCG